MIRIFALLMLGCASILFVLRSAPAVTIDLVAIDNAGDAPDRCYDNINISIGVASAYQIGKYEVTVGQYTEFSNAVAGAAPKGLYNNVMGGTVAFDASLQRTGLSPTYSYSVADDYANLPVNYESFWDAARVAN